MTETQTTEPQTRTAKPPPAEPQARTTEPPPARVRGNDWTTLAVDPPGEFTPRRSATVVVPYYQAPEALALTLAALEAQTYPRDLFEVVVVDDGSDPPLPPITDSPLTVRVVHQPDRGFGLARARNTGARVAAGEILVFLDCDMMPEADWLASHARWHHAASDVLSIGFRAHVSEADLNPAAVRSRTGSLADLFEGRPVERPEWIDFHMSRTADLTAWSEDLFRVVTGGNFGISRRFYDLVGGFDETFTQWGAEDIEFGFRAFTRAGVLVPERSAFCWHQGPGATPSPAEQSSLDLQRAKIAHLIAHSGFRRDRAGRSFTVPQYVVSVGPGPLEMVFAAVEQVLASGIHDLVVWVEDGAGPSDSAAGPLTGDEREWLNRQFGPDPRVRFGPVGGALDCFPHASFHIAIPAAATVKYPLIRRMRWSLSSADLAVARLDNGAEVRIARTRVLHRALRSGLDIADVGHVRKMSPAGLGLQSGARSVLVNLLTRRYARFLPGGLKFWALGAKPVGHPGGHYDVDHSEIRRLSKLTRMLSRIRSFEDLRLFLLWIGFAAKWRIDRRRNAIPHSLASPPRPPGPAAAASAVAVAEIPTVPLGADRLSVPAFDPATDLIALDRLSVPVFDPAVVNPIGWTPDFDDAVVSLGPPELIRPDAAPGVAVRRCWPVYGPADLRRARCVVDVAAYHDGPLQRAAVLAELAAAGAVVHLADAAPPDTPAPAPASAAPSRSSGPGLRECLGPELHDLMSRADAFAADARGRELISIRLRRAALRSHSISARPPTASAPAPAAGPPPSWPPEVSVLLPTRRPDMLPVALANVARQTYPRLELILAAHGDGFDPDRISELTARLDCPVQVVPVAADAPLGRVLDAAASAASGRLLTKFDDDDLYGAEHVWDLVLAREYSRAELVAKGAEYVYLAASDFTIHRFGGKGERFSRRPIIAGGAMMTAASDFTLRRLRGKGKRFSRHPAVAGGTLMVAASDLAAAGGWRPLPARVDEALIKDVDRTGGRIYRTHGAGYVLVRHGVGHTWPADDGYFLAQADLARPGLCPALADIDA